MPRTNKVKSPVTLYGHPISQPTRSVLLLAEEMKLANYKFQQVDITKGEHNSPAFLKVNPHGMVPCITDGDLTLSEGAAILLHLARTRKCRYYPKGAELRAKVDMWLHWSHSGTRKCTLKVLVPHVFGSGVDAEGIASAQDALATLEYALKGSKTNWIAGTKRPSLADFFIVPEIDQLDTAAFNLVKLSPRIKKYLADFAAAVPAYAANFATVCQIAAAIKSGAAAKPKPHYELIYFDIPALGEPIRLLLALGNFDFTDRRITREEWSVLAPTTKYGQLPVLRVNGEEMSQSVAIVRYLATKVSLDASKAVLYPSSDAHTCYSIDEWISTIEDARIRLSATFGIQDEAERSAARAKMFGPEGGVTELYSLMNGRVVGDHLVGSRTTVADIFLFYSANALSCGFFQGVPVDFMKNYPDLERVVRGVAAIPAIQAYYAKFADQPLYKVFQGSS